MNTVICANCGTGLETENGPIPSVGISDRICPNAFDGYHVSKALAIVDVSAKVAVDADAWTLAYGTIPDEIAADVRDYVLERMRGMITDEMQVRDVSVKGA